tara:strand:+ start:201 stop:1535 length:1335 start_codon:yes stop_codon:yes gene_type:complete
MPNYNPLTNAVGGAGATEPNQYYNLQPTNFGEYQYIYLTDVVDNFVATYVGEGKILQKTLRGDVNFHAHRALQELHYDTLKSCKSHEIEVCPSLVMPLPHDYVNYVKITSVDANGIEHIIYPTRHTSHPFAIEQKDNCEYEFNPDGSIKHQQTCEADTEVTCDNTAVDEWVAWHDTIQASWTWPQLVTIDGTEYTVQTEIEATSTVQTAITSYCQCMSTNPTTNCGSFTGWTTCTTNIPNEGEKAASASGRPIPSLCGWDGSSYETWLDNGFPTTTFTSPGTCTLNSNAWTNYSSSGGNSSVAINTSLTTNPSVDVDNYFSNFGERYGIEPEHAQVNGSYFIDCMRGNIHFSSNLSGKTIILKYISDGHGTDDEQIVHKFAEEAMYKWIAYGCASARVDVPENVIQRLKKEKFAETRKAKIRLSSIKIEEIAQIMRGKSKWIKH